jgi:plastocyanin
MNRRIPFALFITALAIAAPEANAEPTTDPVQVVTHRSTYMPGDDELSANGAAVTLYAPQGYGLTVTNLDAFAAHSLTSDTIVNPLTGARLFESGMLNLRDSRPVLGTAALPPGTYRFHCSVHEDNMRGTLVVLGR